jgi:type II secretory pathway pseudopilin PulG
MKCRFRASAFTVIEMLTTVAVLIIVLGLMVSLARHVRQSSEAELTRKLLFALDRAIEQYQRQNGSIPPVTPLIAEGDAPADELALQRTARLNNVEVIRALRRQQSLPDSVFRELSYAYDPGALRDAWGNPIVFMATQHPAIGMARGSFFFSSGPDRQYLTRDDNLYSYEIGER